VREVLRGWSAAVARNGIVVGRETGSGVEPAIRLVDRLVAFSWSPVASPHVFPVKGPAPRIAIAKPAQTESSVCAFADKVLGLAAFRAGALLGAKVMWGEIASRLAVLEGCRRGIPVYYHRLVPSIMDRTGANLCPMENLAFKAKGDIWFYFAFKQRMKDWKVPDTLH